MEAQAFDMRCWRKESGPLPVGSWMPSQKDLKSVWPRPSKSKVVLKNVASGEYSHPLEDAIKESKSILALENDFDGEGSSGYSIETWRRAVKFLRRYASEYWVKTQTCLVIPQILPGPSGSIDIFWKTKGIELLVNFPSDQNQYATFYGDRANEGAIKGNLNPKSFNTGLLEWLTKK